MQIGFIKKQVSDARDVLRALCGSSQRSLRFKVSNQNLKTQRTSVYFFFGGKNFFSIEATTT